MARFTETVDIRQAPTLQFDNTSLTNRLDTFSAQQAQVHAQQTAERSFAAGKSSFQEGQAPEFKKERFFGNVASSSYNKGLRAAYVASIDRDNREQISKIVAENPSNLSAFNDQVESYRKATLNNIDASAREVVDDSMLSLISANRIRVQSNEIQKNHKENALAVSNQIEAATTDALGFSREGDPRASAESALAAFAAVDGAIDAGFISAEEGKLKKRSIEMEITQEGLKGGLFRTFDGEGPQAAFDELDNLSDKVPKGFAPEEWDAFISDAQTDLNRKLSRQKQDLKANAKAVSLEQSIERGFLFTNPSIPADPAKSSQDRKDVNNYYDSVSPDWQGDPDQIINQNAKFIEDTGIVPDKLISNMNAVMRSGDPSLALVHTELLQRVQEDSPQSLRDFTAESRAVSLQISDSVNNGLDVETAAEAARKNTFGLTPTQKEEIKVSTSGKNLKERMSTFDDMVDGAFDPEGFFSFLRSAPDVPPGMQAAYLNNLDNFMSITGANVEQSEQLAFESLKNVWGVTETGGKRRFMQYPPESFYSVKGFDDDWIEDQFLEETELLGIEGALIGIDDRVPRMDAPSYPIIAPNAQGIMDIVEGADGAPLRFQPVFSETEIFKDLSSQPEREFKKSKNLREAKLSVRAGQIQRGINARVFTNAGLSGMTKPEKLEFMATEEGKEQVRSAINNMLVSGKLDQVEALEALEGFSAGTIDQLPAFDILVKAGKLNGVN